MKFSNSLWIVVVATATLSDLFSPSFTTSRAKGRLHRSYWTVGSTGYVFFSASLSCSTTTADSNVEEEVIPLDMDSEPTENDDVSENEDFMDTVPLHIEPSDKAVFDMEAVESEILDSEASMESEPMESEPMESEPMESEPMEGEPREGKPREGKPREGEPYRPDVQPMDTDDFFKNSKSLESEPDHASNNNEALNKDTLESKAVVDKNDAKVLDTDFLTTDSGLTYRIVKQGNGEGPAGSGRTVKAHYTGWLHGFYDDKFDSSRDREEPLIFIVGTGSVIRAWDEIFASMTVGEQREIIVPPKLGYGDKGAGKVIPPGSTLYFEVELVDVFG